MTTTTGDNNDDDAMLFSAKDQENDLEATNHCAQVFGGGWWYNGCYFWSPTGSNPEYWGFIQYGLAGSQHLQKTRMMMKISG